MTVIRLTGGSWQRFKNDPVTEDPTEGIGDKDTSAEASDVSGVYPEASFTGGKSQIRRIAMRFIDLDDYANPSKVELFLKWSGQQSPSGVRACSPSFESSISDAANFGHIFAACADPPGGDGDTRLELADQGDDWWSVEIPSFGEATTCEVALIFEHDIDGTPHTWDVCLLEDHDPSETAPYLDIIPAVDILRYRYNKDYLVRRREYYSGYEL